MRKLKYPNPKKIESYIQYNDTIDQIFVDLNLQTKNWKKSLTILNPNKSLGWKIISANVVKGVSGEIFSIVKQIFNFLLNQGDFLENLKIASVNQI